MSSSLHLKLIILAAMFFYVTAIAKGDPGDGDESSCSTSIVCTSKVSSGTTSKECTQSSSCVTSTESSSSSESDDSSTSTSDSTQNLSPTRSNQQSTYESSNSSSGSDQSSTTSSELKTRASDTLVTKDMRPTPSMSSSAFISPSSKEKTSPQNTKTKSRTVSASPTRSVSMATSSVGSSNQKETREDIVLRMQKPYSEDLKNKTSQAFKDLEGNVSDAFNKVFQNNKGYLRSELNDVKKGSILASTSVYFSSGTTSSRSIRSTLDEAHRSGALSGLGVSEIKYQEENGQDEQGMSTFTYVLIAVGVVAGIAICVFIISKVRTKVKARSEKAAKKQQVMDDLKPNEEMQTTKKV